MFKKKDPMDMFSDAAFALMNNVSDFFEFQDYWYLETYALLYVAVDYGFMNAHPQSRMNAMKYFGNYMNVLVESFIKDKPELKEYNFNSRLEFYGSIIRNGKVRGDYAGPLFHSNGFSVLTYLTVAYLDCMQDQLKVKDYYNAPVIIEDILDVADLLDLTKRISNIIKTRSIHIIESMVR